MASAKKQKTTVVDDSQLRLLYSDEAQFKHWESHLFNEVYLKRDLPEKQSDLWKDTNDLAFQDFQKTLRDLAGEYKNREKELTNWSETETINNWVKHVLVGLGWGNNCSGVQNPFLEETSFRYDNKTYRTDILIVDHPKEKQYINQAKGDDKLVEARQSILVPVEVKYWQRLEEYRQGEAEKSSRADSDIDDITRTTTPNEQIVQYMQILKKDWGILTDGARWRLFSADLSSEDANRYYEFNLYSLVQSLNTAETEADRAEVLEASKYFYHFFSKQAFNPLEDGAEPFVTEVIRYSKKYVNKVEEDLKDRFVKAMNIVCNGLFKSIKGSGKNQNLEVIRNVAESILFNVLFLKSLESRGVLPMTSTDYRKISLSSIIDKIERFDPDRDDLLNVRDLERAFKKGNGNSFNYDSEKFEIHDRVVRLMMIIHDGNSKRESFGFEIAGFKESIFSKEEWGFFKSSKLSNQDWVRVLFQLGYADSESMNRKYQQIPYSYFTPRQLGSIYESFLEFQLQEADEDLVFEDKQWSKANLQSSKYKNTEFPTVKKGDLFFTPNNVDRKMTGAYYTPDPIVRRINSLAISKLLDGKSSKEILDLKIADIAMGSGHFLVDALNILTRSYLSVLSNELKDDLKLTMPEAKRKVLASCLYGADINGRAIKLAKMSLWLETADPNKTLEDLGDQLKTGDSLVGGSFSGSDKGSKNFSWKSEFPDVAKKGGFDAIVGNPPYIYSRNEKLGEDYKAELYRNYKSYSPQLNTFSLFMERATTLINSKGKVSYIVPNNWMTINTFASLRDFYLEQDGDIHLVNIQDKVFEDAQVDTCIFFFDKELPGEVKLEEMKNGEIVFSHTTTKDVIVESGGIFNITAFRNPGVGNLIKMINSNSILLETIATVSTGLKAYQTGKGSPKQSEETKRKRAFHSMKKDTALHKKYLEGKDVCRYHLGWSGEYLKYGDFLAEPRKSVPFKGSRILVRQIPNKPPYMVHAVYTEGDFLNDINSMVIFEPQNGISLKFILGIINSRIISQWFEGKFDKMQRNIFPQFKVGELKQFPMPNLDINKSGKDKKAHDEIVEIVDQLLELDHDSKEFKKLNEKLDLIVEKLFVSEKKLSKVA